MSRFSIIKHKSFSQYFEVISLILCWAMAFGFNYSRAVLSISIVLFFVVGLHPNGLRRRFKMAYQDTFTIVAFLYFLAILISGLWSNHNDNWGGSVSNAAAFAVMPFSMLMLPFFKAIFVKRMVIGIAVIMISGLIWSFSQYLSDLNYYGFLERHIPTAPALKLDHIRYTIGLAFSMSTYLFILRRKREYQISTVEQIILYTGVGLTALYINLQIGKIGMIAFYGISLMLLLYILFTSKNKVLKLIILIGMPFLLYFSTTTERFKNIWNTFQHELAVFSSEDLEGIEKTNSFAPRLISFDVALQILSDHPILGVGAGDVKSEMIKAYDDEYASVDRSLRLVPHSQYLYSFLALGFPLGSLLILMLIMGLVNRTDPKVKIYVASITVVTMVICLIEAILIVQMSIYAYLFFLLFFRNIKNLPQKEVVA